jgi:hypothetical protein
MPRQRRVRGRGPNADTFEREQQRAKARQRTQHKQLIGGRAVRIREDALAERNRIEPIVTLAHVAGDHVLGDPCGVERLAIRAVGPAQHTRPEAARGRRFRTAAFVNRYAQQRHCEVVRRARKRQDAHVPLAYAAQSDRRQCPEPFEPRTVAEPATQRKRAVRRIQLVDQVIEVGGPAVAGFEQRDDEAIGTGGPFVQNRFPQRHRQVGVCGHDAVVVHADAGGERGEQRRAALVEARQKRRVGGKELQGLVIERGEAMTQQRGGPVRQNRGNQVVAADPAMEDGVAPGIGRERHGNRFRQIGTAEQRSGISCRLSDRLQERRN